MLQPRFIKQKNREIRANHFESDYQHQASIFLQGPFSKHPTFTPPKKKLHKAELRAGCTNL